MSFEKAGSFGAGFFRVYFYLKTGATVLEYALMDQRFIQMLQGFDEEALEDEIFVPWQDFKVY